MTALEKTITILNQLPESQIEQIYNFALFISIQNRDSAKLNAQEIAEKRRSLLQSKKYIHKTGRTKEEIDRSIQEMRDNDRI